MSFTIKCDKCGNVYKYTERKSKTARRRSGKLIIISTETEGDAIDWLVFQCLACGHKLEDL